MQNHSKLWSLQTDSERSRGPSPGSITPEKRLSAYSIPRVIRCTQKVDVLRIMHSMARNRGDPTPAARRLNVCMHEVRREAHKLGRLGYKTVTIGFTAGVGSRVSEWGVAFDIRRNPQKVRGYITSRSLPVR